MSTLLEQLREALAPQYEVQRELGTGGMGSVFLARDPNLDRHVAIKVLRPDLASEAAPQRFQREARVVAGLKHPNIVPVYQAGQADDLSYYVMEYVDGETLARRLERGQLPKEVVLKLADDLLSALAAAHDKGIVHRDVKPSNIFLVGDRAMLGDFGIAKRAEESGDRLTATDHRVGTPGYMAPEQYMGDAVTPATDVYAVGMVLYEALTGRKWSIFTPTDEGDWSGVPDELRPPLRRALAWFPSERWVGADTFRGALAGHHSASITLRVHRAPYQPSSMPPFRAISRAFSYPTRRAAQAGFVYSLVAYALIQLADILLYEFVPAPVWAGTLILLAAGLPLSVYLTYRRAKTSIIAFNNPPRT